MNLRASFLYEYDYKGEVVDGVMGVGERSVMRSLKRLGSYLVGAKFSL